MLFTKKKYLKKYSGGKFIPTSNQLRMSIILKCEALPYKKL